MAIILIRKIKKANYGVLTIDGKTIERWKLKKGESKDVLEHRYKTQGSINPDVTRHRLSKMVEVRDYSSRPKYAKGDPHFYTATIKIGNRWITASSSDTINAPDQVKKEDARRALAKRVSAYLYGESNERMGQQAIAEVMVKADKIDPKSYKEGWVYYREANRYDNFPRM